jgi:integron integrase
MQQGSEQSPFLGRVCEVIRTSGYSIRTEQSYVPWVKRFILFHGKRHPDELGEAEVAAFLTHLAVNRNVSPSTQNQALNALVFLYRYVLDRPLGDVVGAVRAKRPERLPVVLGKEEVRQVFAHLDGPHWLPACLLYGSGLRLMECLRLRVKDLDFEHRAITVRGGKGGKDRVVTMPDACIEPLKQQLALVRRLHNKDLQDGFGAVWLPYALARKYPRAASEFGWQYVFPATKRSVDPRSGVTRRHHLDESCLQRAIKLAIRKAGITKPASCHTLRKALT